MSIATLKKKSKQYNTMSVGRTGFSLNGTHRNQGFVGQNIISRSFPLTLFRGNTARGYGGNNGNYHTPPNIVSGINYQNDPTFIKSSVLGTTGMIMTKYRWIRRPQPFATVKSNSANNNNNQGALINKKRLIATTDSILNTGGYVSLLPLPFTSNVHGLCNLTGNGTQNGVYKVAQSSGIGYNAFNGSVSGWKSDTKFDLTGSYTGSSAMTVQDYGTISGEWLRLQIPTTLGQLFTLTKYSISPIVSEFNSGGFYSLNYDSSPNEWYVLGSIDGKTWNVVDHQHVGTYLIGINLIGTNYGTYWANQKVNGNPVLPLTFSINNKSSKGYVYYTILFVSNGASNYKDTNIYNNTYVGIQNLTYSGLVQKGLNQGCSTKINCQNKISNNITKNAFSTVTQSVYIGNKQKVCISNTVSDLKMNTCTPGF
jgi:hypothetical protein